MPTFKYKVRDKFGKAVSGVITGESKEAVAKHLESMRYAPISIAETKESAPAKFLGFLNKVSLSEVNLFSRQLVTLQRAGVPLLLSLDSLKKQTRNVYFKSVIQQMVADIESGNSLSAALSRYPRVFNELYISMVRAGEAAGTMDDMLDRLAGLGEEELLMRSRVKSATRYPLIVVMTLAVALSVILGFVIPRFAALFEGFKIPLPLPTRILLSLSAGLRQYWPVLIMAITGTVFGFFKLINTKEGRLWWDNFKLRVIIFGDLILMVTMSRFSRVTAILLKSGLPILQILDLVKRTTGNVIVERALDQIKTSVADGKGLSEPMRISALFPPMVVQMVAIERYFCRCGTWCSLLRGKMRRRGFSAVEFIVTCAILFVFIGTASFYFTTALKVFRESALKNQLADIRLSLKLYHMFQDKYPADIRGLLTEEFNLMPYSNAVLKKKYVDSATTDKEGYPLDPFGNRFVYRPDIGEVCSGTKIYEKW
ncbi:MAG: type II secretion system F family protein [Candidatus Omnitrophica bacterium]|nr:type II secretion system F family protein [Candidatus Omnitrophota bacterium]